MNKIMLRGGTSFGIIALIFLAVAAGPVPDLSSKDGVLADYPRALAALEGRSTHCDGEGVLSVIANRSGRLEETPRQSRVEFAFSGMKGRSIQSAISVAIPKNEASTPATKKGKKPKLLARAAVFSEHRSFELSKIQGSSAFSIDMLESDSQKGKRSVDRMVGFYTRFATVAAGFEISPLFGKTGFQIDQLTKLPPVDQSRRLKIEFSIPADPKSLPGAARISSGWFVVSPDDGWLLHDYGIVLTPNSNPAASSTRIGYVRYRKGSSGEIHPDRCGYRTYKGALKADSTSEEVPPFSSEEFQFTKFRYGDNTPPGEFTLAAFGLPEFDEPAAKRLNRTFPWWIVGVGAGAAGLTLVLRRLARRRQVATSETTS